MQRHASYVIREHQYFLDSHTDYDATASSTLAPQGKRTTTRLTSKPIRSASCKLRGAKAPKDDGIGQSITLKR